MECPYCNKELKKGGIQSPYEITWTPKRAKAFGDYEFYKGSIVLCERSLLKGSWVTAYICEDCKKVIIDYDNNSEE